MKRSSFTLLPYWVAIAVLAGSASGQARMTKLSDFKPRPLAPIRFPEPERITLPNGMTVFLLEDHEIPTVTAAVRIRTGARMEPPALAGLASITGRAMRSGGMVGLDAAALDAKLDVTGARLEIDIGDTSGIGFVYAYRDQAPEVLAMLADLMRKPALPQSAVDDAKAQMINTMQRHTRSPDAIATEEIGRLLYGNDSPYSLAPTVSSVLSIQREDVVKFHQQYFRPHNLVMGIWGDFKIADIRQLVARKFGAWEDTNTPPPPLPKVDKNFASAQGGKIYVVNQPGAANAIVALGGLGGQRNDPNYFAAALLARIISGALWSRIRVNEGLSYSVNASWAAQFDFPGMCVIKCDTKSSNAAKALRSVRAELAKIVNDGIDAEDLRQAKDAMIRGMAFEFDTVDKVITRFIDYEYYQYPRDYVRNLQSSIEKVTLDDLRVVAREFWDPGRMAIMIVGDVQGLDEQLAAFGTVRRLQAE